MMVMTVPSCESDLSRLIVGSVFSVQWLVYFGIVGKLSNQILQLFSQHAFINYNFIPFLQLKSNLT